MDVSSNDAYRILQHHNIAYAIIRLDEPVPQLSKRYPNTNFIVVNTKTHIAAASDRFCYLAEDKAMQQFIKLINK